MFVRRLIAIQSWPVAWLLLRRTGQAVRIHVLVRLPRCRLRRSLRICCARSGGASWFRVCRDGQGRARRRWSADICALSPIRAVALRELQRVLPWLSALGRVRICGDLGDGQGRYALSLRVPQSIPGTVGLSAAPRLLPHQSSRGTVGLRVEGGTYTRASEDVVDTSSEST